MHADAKAGKVVEMERTWTIDKHVCATSYWRCKADCYAEHKRHYERHGTAAHNLSLLIHNREEYCSRTYIAYKLAHDRGKNAHNGHNYIWVSLTHIKYRMSHSVSNTCLGDGHREHYGYTKNE